jgi:hypothetical protein
MHILKEHAPSLIDLALPNFAIGGRAVRLGSVFAASMINFIPSPYGAILASSMNCAG